MSVSGVRPLALVTGASSGIGREIARVAASEGHDVALVARSEGSLAELAAELRDRHGSETHVMPADLSGPEAPGRLVGELEARDLAVDVLVNNAGFGTSGPFVGIPWEEERDLLAVNVAALTELTKRVVPRMVERGSGRILQVASTAAYQPGPGMAVYYASKAYVLNLGVALALELDGTGVTATVVCPGPTRTGFADRADVEASRLFRGERGMDPREVARVAWRATMRGDPVAIPGVSNKLGAAFAHLVPRTFAARVVGWLNAEPEG